MKTENSPEENLKQGLSVPQRHEVEFERRSFLWHYVTVFTPAATGFFWVLSRFGQLEDPDDRRHYERDVKALEEWGPGKVVNIYFHKRDPVTGGHRWALHVEHQNNPGVLNGVHYYGDTPVRIGDVWTIKPVFGGGMYELDERLP